MLGVGEDAALLWALRLLTGRERRTFSVLSSTKTMDTENKRENRTIQGMVEKHHHPQNR